LYQSLRNCIVSQLTKLVQPRLMLTKLKKCLSQAPKMYAQPSPHLLNEHIDPFVITSTSSQSLNHGHFNFTPLTFMLLTTLC